MPDFNFCLVVVFNHRFDQNLPRLRSLYQGRFSTVRFLVPFYRGDDPDVIPVFDSSATFQGYFAQARHQLSAEGLSHYVFVADDLLLNPATNETNLHTYLRLQPEGGYTKYLKPISSVTSRWTHFNRTLRALCFDEFVNARAELPPREEAVARLAAHGLECRPLGWRNLEISPGPWQHRAKEWVHALWLIHYRREGRNLPYPLLLGYADLLVVPASALAEFCHLCGVFSAMGIFVECAAPTALALSVPHLSLERDLVYQGLELWSDADRDAFWKRYFARLPELLENFPENCLYVHPVKLPHWRTEDHRSGSV